MSFADRRTMLLILLALSVTCIFTKLGLGFLPSYDDGYYAQKAREILASGDWLTPRIANVPRFDNPPGFMWLIAGSFKLFGVDEFSARFPSALAGVLGIIGTFYLFELLLTTRIAFLAAVILNLTSLYLKYARHSMMDVTVAAACVWSSYCFIRGLRGSGRWFWACGLIGAYVPFAKSLFGSVPPTVFFTYLVATRQWSAFRRWNLWAGLLLYCAPYAVWCRLETLTYGTEFLHSHFHDLMFSMATRGGSDDHHYDYVLVLLKYFPVYLPFMLYGGYLAARARGTAARGQWFGLIYTLCFFVMLSVQSTTKTWYFISALPGCAGLAAVGMDRALRKFSLEQITRAVAGLTFASYLVIQMTPVTLGVDRAVDTKRIAPYVRAAAEQGFRIAAYRTDYFGLNSSLLFYSDQEAPNVDDDGLAALLNAPGKVAVIFATSEWERLRAAHPNLTPVRASQKLVLVSNAALNQERIF